MLVTVQGSESNSDPLELPRWDPVGVGLKYQDGKAINENWDSTY